MEILGKVGFDWQVALANLINFLIVFWLIKRFFFKPIRKTIKDRKEIIDKGLEDAKRAEAALVTANTQKEGIIKDAHNESKSILEDAGKKAKALVAQSKKDGQKEADKIKEDAIKSAEKLEAETNKKLQKEYVNLLIDGLEKVSIDNFDKNKSEKFAQSLLK